MRGEKEESSVCPQRPRVGVLHHLPSSPLCLSTLSRCHIHERWFLTQINTTAGLMLGGPKLQKGGEKWSEHKKEKKRRISDSCFICDHLASYSFTFSSLKKTAGWHVVHLSLKVLGHKCMDEQVVNLSVWPWICLCLETRWQTRAWKKDRHPLSGERIPPRTLSDTTEVGVKQERAKGQRVREKGTRNYMWWKTDRKTELQTERKQRGMEKGKSPNTSFLQRPGRL